MRSILWAGLALLLTVWAAAPARADVFSVSVDVPVTYSFDEAALGDPSANGYMVGVSLPFLVGLGYESYTVEGTTTTAFPYEYNVSMVDLFLNIPFPVANLVLGAGVGRGEFVLTGSGITHDDATLTQLFFSVGIPFAGLFDAHVGYRVVGGEASASNGGTTNLSSSLATVGLKVGF